MQDMLEIAMIAAEEAGGEIMNVYDSNRIKDLFLNEQYEF